MGWIASLFQDGCDYARLTGDIVRTIAIQDDAPWLEVGFAAYREPIQNIETGEWDVVYTGSCLEYPEDVVDIDTNWNVAKAFAFLALVLGGGGTFFLWFNTCCVFSRGTWRWAGYEVLLASIFQTLSFLWFNTSMCQDPQNDCSLFWGSKTDIVASVFWFVAAVSIFCYYPQPKDVLGDGLMAEGEANNYSDDNSIIEDDSAEQHSGTPDPFSIDDDDGTGGSTLEMRNKQVDARISMESGQDSGQSNSEIV